MSIIQIKNRWNLSVIFECEAESLKMALEIAVKGGSDLSGSNLTPIRDDLWAVLSCAPSEAEGLRQSIIDGKIDGSHYEGKCVCLVGTIAKVRNCVYTDLGALQPNSNRPSERFFLSIKPGDMPETSQFSKLALEWVDMWLSNMKSTFAPKKEN